MLRSLSIRNLAIIDRLDVEFGSGLNVLTGETGAGKSIVIDALNLILGARAGAEMVRAGVERAVIDAVFDIGEADALLDRLGDMGFDAEDGALYLSREVTAAGKSGCRVGGRPAAVSQLREIGDWLVDLHGQHEHQSLMAVGRHIDILDEWGGVPVRTARAEATAAFAELERLVRERDRLLTDARERRRLLDLYGFQVREITEAALTPGEDELLDRERRRAANAQRLLEAAAAAADALSGEDGGVLESLRLAVRTLEDAAALDAALAPAADTLRSALYELTETERDLVRYQDSIEISPERLGEIEERLDLIRSLRRKYGDSIEDVLQFGDEAARRAQELADEETRGAALDAELERAERRIADACGKLSHLRCCAAQDFSAATRRELTDLGMEKTRFDVKIETIEPTAHGADRVEFLIAANAGEPLRPLSKIASGGEISRVMLAIKSAMARQEPLPTMVFDEIDAGVGGRTASVIADKLQHLSRAAQVLCITHLARIASRADRHFLIEKREEDGRTHVAITLLDRNQREQEIARMIGGTQVTETVLRSAREMLHRG